LVLLGDADAKARQVVVTGGVQPRHLRRLTAGEGAARQFAALGNTCHHGGGDLEFEPSGGVVVKKKEGLGPGHQDVVGAHGHQVDPNGVVATQFQGQFQLGAYAIRPRYQHRLAVFVQG
jgi:hypothetical protein